jgi:electron transfer flavoprotein alpha/beta subunit
MNIIVCAKQVVDVAEIKVDSSTKKPILAGVPQKISDMDKNALEEAIKMKEKHGGKITVITVGAPDAKERMKELLAMGADEGVLIPIPDYADYHAVAHLLAAGIKKLGQYDVIICGEASIDMFSGQMGPRIAGLLNLPQITYAQTLTVEKDKVTAERNLGEKAITIESPYPVVITVTKESNQPRLPSLMAILASSSKPIHDWSVSSLMAEPPASKVKTIDVKGIPMQRKNIIYQDDLDQSIGKLVDELAKVGVLR